MSPKDRKARESFVKLIEERQEDEARKSLVFVVPKEPTGLPDNYDVLIYGDYVGMALLRLEVRVRGNRATGEMVTDDGVCRGDLPAQQIDHLIRELAFAYRSKRSRRADAPYSFTMRGMVPHLREQRIEVISRDEKRPFFFRSQPWQFINDTILGGTEVSEFGFTVVGQSIETLAREKLTLVKPNGDLVRELVVRLKRIGTPKACAQRKGAWEASGKGPAYAR